MTKKYMRIISILLVSAVLICAFPLTAFADENQLNTELAPDTKSQVYIEADEIIPNPNYKPLEITNMSNSNSIASPFASKSTLTGVYRIKNVYNGKYLDVRGGGVSSGTAIQQWTLDETSRNQLFKITYLATESSSGSNYYSIRPMTNSGMGLSAPVTGTSRYATIQTMELSENSGLIPASMRWTIAESGNYYTIKNGASSVSSYLSTPSNSSNGSQVMTITSSTSTNAKWVLEEYTGDSIDGMAMINYSNTIYLGDIYDFDAIMYSSTIGQNGPVIYGVRNPDGSETDKAVIDSSSGVLTPLKAGNIQVITYYQNSPWIWVWNIELKYAYNISLSTYYDYAFNVRYSRANNIIIGFSDQIQDIMGQVFGLNVQINNPIKIYSTPDYCKLYNNLEINLASRNHMCPANPSLSDPKCSYYTINQNANSRCKDCTSWNQIYDDFIEQYPGTKYNASVLFTGSILYDENGQKCNRSFKSGYGFIFQETPIQYDEEMLSCFIHELSHFINAPDHYHEILDDGTCRGGTKCNDCYPSSGRPSWCIMDNGWRDDLETCDRSTIYCSECVADIKNYLAQNID